MLIRKWLTLAGIGITNIVQWFKFRRTFKDIRQYKGGAKLMEAEWIDGRKDAPVVATGQGDYQKVWRG